MTSDLERKLAALAGEGSFEAGAMQLGPSGDPSAMAAILNAIDDTMLPRHMEFGVGASSVTLSVAGKRLRTVVAASDDLKAPSALISKLLASDDVDALTKLGELLSALTSGEGTLTLTRKVGPAAAGQADAGVGVNTLVSLWDVDLDATPPTRFEQFTQLLGDKVLCGAEIDDKKLLNPVGDAGFVKALETTVKDRFATIRQEHATMFSVDDLDQMVAIPGLLPDEAVLCAVKFNDTNMILALAEGSTPEIATAWARVSGK